MSQPVVGAEWLAAYAAAFRRDAHQLLAWGYQDSRAQLGPNLDEEVITGMIVGGMRSRLGSAACPKRFRRYSVHEDRPAEGEGRTGRRRRRIDILIEASYSQPRPLYAFEAKRLRTGSHPLRDYVGDEGLGRYVSGATYGKGQPEAGMLAYVQDRGVADWSADLLAQFERDANLKQHTASALRRLQSAPGLSECWISDHTRRNGAPIRICHIFLDCV